MITKRLAVISYHTCPISDETDAEIGGMNIYVLELSKALAKRGCQIDIFTRSQAADSPRIVEVEQNLRVIHLPAGPQKPLSKKKIASYIPHFIAAFNEFRSTEKVEYDTVSCHYFLSGLIGIAIKKELKIPMLITFHTLGLMKNLVARSDEEREGKDRIVAEMQIIKEADRIIATSETDAEYIRALYEADPKKLLVLNPGVDLERFQPMDKSKAKHALKVSPEYKLVLFVGRVEPLKGIDVLLYSIKILQHTNPDLKLCVWIVGGDVSKDSELWSQELKKLASIRSILDLSATVKFLGRKKPDELPNYYNAADVMVMPSHYESFGITAVEAMACGTPVITTDVTGVSNVFDEKHAFLITSANNTLQLADRIAYLLTEKKEYEKLRQELAANVQELSWDNTAQKFIEVCASCRKK